MLISFFFFCFFGGGGCCFMGFFNYFFGDFCVCLNQVLYIVPCFEHFFLFFKGTCGVCFAPKSTGLLLHPSPLPIIFLCSDDHIICLHNIKSRCVLISIYRINPGIIRLQNEFAAAKITEGRRGGGTSTCAEIVERTFTSFYIFNYLM